MRILAGDIGGTNTRLCIFERDDRGQLVCLGEPKKFKNAGTRGLHQILDQYLRAAGDAPTDACFGVAGPVDGRQVQLTNIPDWPVVDADEIARQLGIAEAHRVNLINDMPAHAASLSTIESTRTQDVVTIVRGEPRATGSQVICMPGTGLGIGLLVWDAHSALHRPVPTEAGHADLAARDEQTRRLLDSMRHFVPESEVVSREHVLSGPGLREIYACLANPASPDLDAAPAAEDFLNLESTDPVAKAALDLFTRIFGQVVGNLALEYLATGSIYLAGSIATSLRARLASPLFMQAMHTTGPAGLRGLVKAMPVKLITCPDTGLLGAATYASWAQQKRV
jgi:glucokinase